MTYIVCMHPGSQGWAYTLCRLFCGVISICMKACPTRHRDGFLYIWDWLWKMNLLNFHVIWPFTGNNTELLEHQMIYTPETGKNPTQCRCPQLFSDPLTCLALRTALQRWNVVKLASFFFLPYMYLCTFRVGSPSSCEASVWVCDGVPGEDERSLCQVWVPRGGASGSDVYLYASAGTGKELGVEWTGNGCLFCTRWFRKQSTCALCSFTLSHDILSLSVSLSLSLLPFLFPSPSLLPAHRVRTPPLLTLSNTTLLSTPTLMTFPLRNFFLSLSKLKAQGQTNLVS